jgi:hypothetical protein
MPPARGSSPAAGPAAGRAPCAQARTGLTVVAGVAAVALALMDERQRRVSTPLLDEWIAAEGEEQVVAAVKAAIQAIEDGTTPGFTDKAALLEYIGRRALG